MKIAVISFSESGMHLGEMVKQGLDNLGHEVETYVKSRHIGADNLTGNLVEVPIGQWVGEMWKHLDGILFIGACGIAVRAIAPFLEDKRWDPAVVVMDEKGAFCISLLSGHLGGANALTALISECAGAVPVITTATDRNDCFAIDLCAKESGLDIRDKELAKEISASLLAKEKIVTVGIGCRKGVSEEQITFAIEQVLSERKIPPECIEKIVSVELKKEEKGILDYCGRAGIPFEVYPASELLTLSGEFSSSLFVQKVTGVDNICERSAVIGSRHGILIQRKTVKNQVTVAVAV
ncbi:MAG: cobalamin biosynthesis protein [Hespellia sp.]|nr:cobalamin biosynthesis protein [Hespellia sp.]